MSKWEDKYNEYKDGGIDNVISELLSKGVTTKEQKKEYDKLVKIKGKMPQVENVIEYRDKLKEQLNELKTELHTRETLANASKKIEQLGQEIDRLQEQSAKVSKQLKDPKLTDEKRAELQAEQNEIGTKMAKTQDGIKENEDILNSAVGTKRDLQDLSTEEIKKRTVDTQTKISKCNMVAHNLLNGLNWNMIDMKLDNWQDRKFTSKDGKLKDEIETSKGSKKEDREETQKMGKEDEEVFYFDDLEEDAPSKNPPALTFAQKHPRLAKIGDFFKGLKDRIFKNGKDDTQNTETKGAFNKEQEDKELDFKEYIKQIAEKGMDGLAAEEKAARQQAAKEKLAKMRAGNREAEAEKFGQEYADQSDYREQDEGPEL